MLCSKIRRLKGLCVTHDVCDRVCVCKREREREDNNIMLLVGHNLIVTVHVYIYTLNCT